MRQHERQQERHVYGLATGPTGADHRADRRFSPAPQAPTSVVVADADRVLRTAARTVLEASGDFLVSEAASSEELNALVGSTRPEIVLVDADLPPAGGVDALEQLSLRHSFRAVIWGFAPTPNDVLGAVRFNTYGYLEKTVSPAALVRSLRGVAGGEACLSRELTFDLIDELQRLGRREHSRRLAASLSSREWEVLELIARGYANKQIAAVLFISEFTVKRHVHNVLAKLGRSSRREAAAAFREARAAEEVLGGLASA